MGRFLQPVINDRLEPAAIPATPVVPPTTDERMTRHVGAA